MYTYSRSHIYHILTPESNLSHTYASIPFLISPTRLGYSQITLFNGFSPLFLSKFFNKLLLFNVILTRIRFWMSNGSSMSRSFDTIEYEFWMQTALHMITYDTFTWPSHSYHLRLMYHAQFQFIHFNWRYNS